MNFPNGRRSYSISCDNLTAADRGDERSAGPGFAVDPDDLPRYSLAAGILPQTIDDTLYDAFGQRQVSTIFTQLNQYHVVLEVNPEFQTESRCAEIDLRAFGQWNASSSERIHAILVGNNSGRS